MRIVSNFRDYYDGCQSLDYDKSTTFVRSSTQDDQNLENFPYSIVQPTQTAENAFVWVAGFVDEIFWGWGNVNLYADKKKITNIKYDYKEYLNSVPFPLFLKWSRNVNSWDEYFEKFKGASQNLFKEYGPLWVLVPGPDYKNSIKIIVSPKMDHYGLAKVLPPNQAYDKLYRYVCNRQNPERPIPQMDNDTKIHQAGFDTKYSFRSNKPK